MPCLNKPRKGKYNHWATSITFRYKMFSKLISNHNQPNELLDSVFTPQPFGLEGYGRHGSGGRVDGRAHISVTAWRIFSIRSSVELSRPVLVRCHGHLPICTMWACPWAKNLSNLPQIGSKLADAYLWNYWMDLPHLKFRGLVWTCGCATS